MKVYIKRTISIISIIAIVILYILVSENLFLYRESDSQARFDGFYLEDKNTLDVVLIGSSEVYNDFSSAIAYDKFGFTSYPIGTPAQNGIFIKYQMKEVLQYQNPKLFIVEVNGFLGDDSISDSQIRNVCENIRLSDNKVSLLSSLNCCDDVYTYYLPFFKYHNDINVGTCIYNCNNRMNQFGLGYSLLKGNYTGIYSQQIDKEVSLENSKFKVELTESNKDNLIDLLTYCKHNNLNVLFVRFPRIQTSRTAETLGRSNAIEDIISTYGYDYLNFVSKIDCSEVLNRSDFYNSEHLNIEGQEKFTLFFGNVLYQKYGIKRTNLNEEQKNKWNNSAIYTRKFYSLANKKLLENSDNVEKYLYEDIKTMDELNYLVVN